MAKRAPKPFSKPNGKGHQGPKPYVIDPEEVRHLASLGCSKEEIAAIVSPPNRSKLIQPDHLEKKYHAVIVKGRMELHRSLRSELVSRALNGNVAALIFALKVYCKMDDKSASTEDSRHLTIHFDYNTAKGIEARSQPIREAVTNMLANYRKDLANTTEDNDVVSKEIPLLEDSSDVIDLDDQSA